MTEEDPLIQNEIAKAADRTKSASNARRLKGQSALSMKIAGATYEEIARVLGYATPTQALRAVERALVLDTKDDPKAQNRMRALAGQRLERLLRGVWAKAIDAENPEHLTAVSKAQSIIDRWAKLYGLDAPAELIVHTPTKQALEAWVDTVIAAGTPQVEEEDIFDADWDEVDEIEGEDKRDAV